MPKSVKNAKILLLNAALEFKKTEVNAKINISTPDKPRHFSMKRSTWSTRWWTRFLKAVRPSFSARRVLMM